MPAADDALVLRVVVAEDEPVIAMGLEETLARLGHRVVGTAGDGETALELARDLSPDLLVVDIKMPGLSGLEVVERLAAEQRAVPTVVLTAHDDVELVERAIASGVGAYLVKPTSQAQLGAAVRLARTRFAEFRALEHEADTLREALETRKLVERAKGLLADSLGLSEADAFAHVQRAARERRISMAEAARRIIDAEALLDAARSGGGRKPGRSPDGGTSRRRANSPEREGQK